jgi:predicted small metal-binding protein
VLARANQHAKKAHKPQTKIQDDLPTASAPRQVPLVYQ